MNDQTRMTGLISKLFGFKAQWVMLIVITVAWAVHRWAEHPDSGFFGAMALLLIFAMLLVEFGSPAGYELARQGRKMKAAPEINSSKDTSPSKGGLVLGIWDTIVICGILVSAAYALTLL